MPALTMSTYSPGGACTNHIELVRNETHWLFYFFSFTHPGNICRTHPLQHHNQDQGRPAPRAYQPQRLPRLPHSMQSCVQVSE